MCLVEDEILLAFDFLSSFYTVWFFCLFFNMMSDALVSFLKKMVFSVRDAVSAAHLLGVALFQVQVPFLIGCLFR